jgi:hypothetical protein
VGRALDADPDPDLRPSRLDTKVPPRRRVESSAEVMAEAEAAGFARDLYLWWRDSGAGGEGDLTAGRPQEATGRALGIKEDWLGDQEHRERLAAWILGVVDAHDSYVGGVHWSAATNQHFIDLVVSHRRRASRADVQLANGSGSRNESRLTSKLPCSGTPLQRSWHGHPDERPLGSSTTRRMTENWLMHYNWLYEDAYDPH